MTIDLSKLSEDALSELVLEYARGSASVDVRAAIEARLPEDPKLADEIAYLQGLHRAVSPLRTERAADEFGWKRLSNAISAEQVPVAANDNSHIWKYAAAALAIVAALQTAVLIQPSTQAPAETYVTASATDANTPAVNVVFQPSATAEALTRVLKEVNGEIIAGPSAIGLYTVAFETETTRDDALAALEAETDLVESVSLK
ncbi:MAG: hypothetical protein AAF269_14955 [Pseudomonadota bacterium]